MIVVDYDTDRDRTSLTSHCSVANVVSIEKGGGQRED